MGEQTTRAEAGQQPVYPGTLPSTCVAPAGEPTPPKAPFLVERGPPPSSPTLWGVPCPVYAFDGTRGECDSPWHPLGNHSGTLKRRSVRDAVHQRLTIEARCRARQFRSGRKLYAWPGKHFA